MVIADSGLGVEFLSGQAFFDSILNDNFLPYVADTVIDPNVLYNRIPDKSERVEGRNIVYPIHTGRNLGVGAMGAGGQLPDPGRQNYEQYAFAVRSVYARIKFDGFVQDASRTSLASWLRGVESEVMGAARDLMRQKQRMIHNDGSGRLCMVDGALVASVDLVVQFNTDIPGAAVMSSTKIEPTQFLRAGQRIAFIEAAGGGEPTATDGVIADTATIVSVDNGTDVTLDAVVSVDDDAWVVTLNNLTTTSVESTGFLNEPMGIAGIILDTNPVHDATFQGIDADAAGNEFHQANLIEANVVLVPVTTTLLDEAWTESMRVGDVQGTAWYGSYGMVQAVAAVAIDTRTFFKTPDVGSGNDYELGYQGINYNVPVIADRDTYPNRLYLPYEPDLGKFVNQTPRWIDDDGSTFHRLPDEHAFQATLYCRDTVGSDVRDRHTLLFNLIE